jgi:hypothetical protein
LSHTIVAESCCLGTRIMCSHVGQSWTELACESMDHCEQVWSWGSRCTGQCTSLQKGHLNGRKERDRQEGRAQFAPTVGSSMVECEYLIVFFFFSFTREKSLPLNSCSAHHSCIPPSKLGVSFLESRNLARVALVCKS